MRSSPPALLLPTLLLAACGSQPTAAVVPDEPAPAPASAEATASEPGAAEAGRAEAASGDAPEGRTFGEPLDPTRALTRLSAILASPDDYDGRVVRTEGEITAVCQARGCWMELREAEGQPSVRVPMAGHSFFLPRNVSGRRARLEGRVVLRELSPEMRAHLEAEGARATASALSIEATGVVID